MYTFFNIVMEKTAVIYRSPLALLQEVHYSVIHKQAGYDFESALKNQYGLITARSVSPLHHQPTFSPGPLHRAMGSFCSFALV